MFELKDKIVLVIGGSGNLGAAEVDAVASFDATVISVHRSKITDSRQNVLHIQADISNPDQHSAIFKKV